MLHIFRHSLERKSAYLIIPYRNLSDFNINNTPLIIPSIPDKNKYSFRDLFTGSLFTSPSLLIVSLVLIALKQYMPIKIRTVPSPARLFIPFIKIYL